MRGLVGSIAIIFMGMVVMVMVMVSIVVGIVVTPIILIIGLIIRIGFDVWVVRELW